MRRARGATLGRAIALLATAITVGTVLTGCDATLPGASTARPQVGTCTDLTLSPEVDSTSNANPGVSCAGAHTLQTFGVNTVPAPLSSWKSRPDQQQLQSLQGTLCSSTALRMFLGATDGDSVTHVSIHGYFPTRADWARGARAVSCDVSVNGAGGAPKSIAHSLARIMTRPESAAIRICYRQKAEPDGLWSSKGTETTCDKPHSSQDIDYWVDVDTASPSAATIAATCDAPAAKFVGASRAASYVVSGVVVIQENKTAQLRCTIGGDSDHGDVTGAILAG